MRILLDNFSKSFGNVKVIEDMTLELETGNWPLTVPYFVRAASCRSIDARAAGRYRSALA